MSVFIKTKKITGNVWPRLRSEIGQYAIVHCPWLQSFVGKYGQVSLTN